MANIMLQKSSVSAIRRQLEKMQSETENAEKKIRSALNGLDFEVASKQNITNSLGRMITTADRQGNLSGQYKGAFLNVTNSIVDSDGKFGNQSQSIFERIRSFVEDKTRQIRDFIISNNINKIGIIAGLFIATPVTIITIADIKLLERIAAIVRSWIAGAPVSINGNDNEIDLEAQREAEREAEAQREAQKKQEEMDNVKTQYSDKLKRLGYSDENIENARNSSDDMAALEEKYNQMIDSAPIKVYEGSSKDYTPGAYSDYNVIKGFDEQYVVKQSTNVNCTSTADAMAGSFVKGKYIDPNKGWIPGTGTTWPQTKEIPGSKSYTCAQQYAEIYNQVSNGNPVIIRVRRSSVDEGHSMVAIGLKNGADPNNLTPADILVADPQNGKVRTLAEYESSNNGRKLYDRNGENNWPMRIVK